MDIINQTNHHIAWLAGKKEYPLDSLTVCVKATFQLVPDDIAQLASEQQMMTGDIFVDDDINKGLKSDSDFAYFKPVADLLLKGSCYTPEGKARSTCPVTFSVGAQQKTLIIHGARYATPGLFGESASTPEPFVAMPITYENAYGGVGYKKNPSGKIYQCTALA